MVSDYIRNGCSYALDGLKPIIYIFDKSILRYIHVDNGLDDAALSLVPTALRVKEVVYSENTSYDERYRFSRQLTVTLSGKININDVFQGKFYIVIEDRNGNTYLTNPDYEYDYSYTYTLNSNTNETVINFVCNSNFPLLALDMTKASPVTPCEYDVTIITRLQMIEHKMANYSSSTGKLTITKRLSEVEYNKDTLQFTEEGDKDGRVVQTLTFNTPLEASKQSWVYNLLEENYKTYTAIIYTNKGNILTGIYNGLQPQYTISNDTYTVSLTEVSNNSSIQFNMTMEELLGYQWQPIGVLDGHNCWECFYYPMGCGWARYWVIAEVDNFGNQTGRYKIEEDIYNGLYVQDDPDVDYSYYVDNYGWIRKYNVTGTFNPTFPLYYFPTNECACKDNQASCTISTDMPTIIDVEGTGSTQYHLRTSCDFEITSSNGITVSPTTGNADTDYTITISNSSSTEREEWLNIGCCTDTYNKDMNIIKKIPCLSPTSQTINCLSQTISFTVKQGCQLGNVQVPAGLSYMIVGGNILSVYVPKNEASSSITYTITATCCNATVTVQILQDKQYSDWIDDGYVCENGSKYIKETLYTGTTADNLVPTDEYRNGAFIESDSPDCRSISKYSFLGNFICIDGDKYKLYQEEISYDDGVTWSLTGKVKLGEFVEEDSAFCEQNVEYKWVLTDDSVCVDE